MRSHLYLPHQREKRISIRRGIIFLGGLIMIILSVLFVILWALPLVLIITRLFQGRHIEVFTDIKDFLTPDYLFLAFGIPFGLYVSIRQISWFLVGTADIKLDKHGIHLYPLDSWEIVVPSESIYAVNITTVKPFALNRRLKVGDKTYVVHIPDSKMSFMHRFVGNTYKLGFAPAFIVTSDHENHEVLLETLQEIALNNKA